MSDAFRLTGNTPCGLGEGWRLSRARRRRDMTQNSTLQKSQCIVYSAAKMADEATKQNRLPILTTCFLSDEKSGPVADGLIDSQQLGKLRKFQKVTD